MPAKKTLTMRKGGKVTRVTSWTGSKYHRKRWKAKANTMKANTIGTVIKQQRDLTMRYATNHSVACTALINNQTYFYRLNSINDPDVANLGKNQVVNGYTVLNSIYRLYRVTEATIKITLHSDPSNSFPMDCCLTGTDDVTPYATGDFVTDIKARPGAISKTLGVSTGNKGVVVLKKKYRVQDIAGIPLSKVKDDPNYGALFAANPVNQAFFALSVSSLPEGYGYVTSAQIQVEIMYKVHVYDLKEAILDN